MILSAALATGALATPVIGQLSERYSAKGERAEIFSRSTDITAQGTPWQINTGSNPAGMPKAKTAQEKLAAYSVPKLYGSVIYRNSGEKAIGLYDVSKPDTELKFLGPMALGGGAIKDGIYYCIYDYKNTYTAYGYDLKTGDVVYEKPASKEDSFIGGFALDPISKEFYGIAYNETQKQSRFAKIAFTEDGPVTTEIKSYGADQGWGGFGITSTGEMYALHADKRESEEGVYVASVFLEKIDRTTGETTTVGDTGATTELKTSACIDPHTNRMFWNTNYYDNTGALYEVDLNNGKAYRIFDYPLGDEIVGMVAPQPEFADATPDACTNIVMDFADGALSGNIKLTAPSKTMAGEPLSGDVTVNVKFGFSNQSVTAAPGAQVTIPVAVTVSTYYDAKIWASNAAGDGYESCYYNLWIGYDTPLAPGDAEASWKDGIMTISWNPVTETLHNGYINTENVKYRVTCTDGSIVTESTSETSISLPVEDTGNLATYIYKVQAISGDSKSELSTTNQVVLGSVKAPWTSDFKNTDDSLLGYTVLDLNTDGLSWRARDAKAKCDTGRDGGSDDWLITPPIELEAGKLYLLAFDAWSDYYYYPQTIEVLWGNAPTSEAMTDVILEPTTLDKILESNPLEINYYLAPKTSGKYYIGVHDMSAPDMRSVSISNISVGAATTNDLPAPVENLTVTAGAYGEMTATVKFNAPSKNIADGALSELTKIEIYREGTLVKTIDNPTPGNEYSFTEDIAEKGWVKYSVRPVNNCGFGQYVRAEAYIGMYYPERPQNVVVTPSAQFGYVDITWDPVTEDMHGIPMREDQITYAIMRILEDNTRSEIVTGLTDTSYTYKAVEDGKQEFVQYGVFAINDYGDSGYNRTEPIIIGTPYEDFEESFANSKFHYEWSKDTSGKGDWFTTKDNKFKEFKSQDGDNGYMYHKGEYNGYNATVYSGLISLIDIENPALTMYVFNMASDGSDINTLEFMIRPQGEQDWTPVYSADVNTICGGKQGWQQFVLGLGQYSGKVIQFGIKATTKAYVYTPLDNMLIESISAHDLHLRNVAVPAKVSTGKNFTIDVEVANLGSHPAEDYTVELYCGEELVESLQGEKLLSATSAVYSFSRSMHPLATENHKYQVKVNYSRDVNPENNISEVLEVAPQLSKYPAPLNLKASSESDGVKLTWNEPNLDEEIAPDPVTADFEDGEAFSNKYGDWTFVDGDKVPVGGFSNIELPNITAEVTTGSFWVWDCAWSDAIMGETAASYAAHSGSKYLFSMYPSDGSTANDWMISPELYGGEQEISFFAKTYHGSYPEKIEVYYSTGSTDPADFILIENVGGVVPNVWKQYVARVPEGAKRFAIRSVATNSFMLMIDDVTYVPVGSNDGLALAGYKVYRDGELHSTEIIGENDWTDSDVEEQKSYTYVVTAVYNASDESQASDKAIITYDLSGINGVETVTVKVYSESNKIIIENAAGLEVSVVNAAGLTLLEKVASEKIVAIVDCGIYLVKVGNRSVKIRVN